MSVWILSTMTNSVCYRTYRLIGEAGPNGAGPLPVPEPNPVTIHGGAGLPSLRSGVGEVSRDFEDRPMWTPTGVITRISDEDYERVKNHWLFKKHLEGHYLKVLDSDISGNIKEIRRQVEMDMQQADEFAQLSKSTIKQRIKVKTPEKSISQDRAAMDDAEESWRL